MNPWTIAVSAGIFLAALVLFLRPRSAPPEKKFSDSGSPYDRILGAALDGVGDPVFITDPDKKIIWCNMAAERVFGSIRGFTWREAMDGEKAFSLPCDIDEIVSRGRVFHSEENFPVRSGGMKPFTITCAPVRDNSGNIVAVVSSLRDLSQIARFEEAEARSRLNYISLFENMSSGFALQKVVADENGTPTDHVFLEVNRAFEELTGLDRRNILGNRSSRAVPWLPGVGFDWIGTLGSVGLTGNPVSLESYFEPLGKWFLLNAYSPEPGHFALLLEDITGRKETEEMARASAEEKEILMGEAHQRLRCNLSTISRILNLQASCRPGEWDWSSKALKDTNSRVMSIALVHRIMSETGDLARIPFARFLEELVEYLKETFGKGREQVGIDIDVPADLTLNVDAAVPCGLILTELVSNSLKHAFPEGSRGAIRITFREDGQGNYVLREEDYGEGIPEHVDLEHPETLGWKLLDSYLEMIRGEKHVAVDRGTSVSIVFPEFDEAGVVRF